MFADNIIWDIDLEEDETYEAACAELELPKRVKLPERFLPGNWSARGLKVEYCDDIEDWLSNEYGYCVKSFALC